MAKAALLGPVGAAWVRSLPSVVSSLAADWSLTSVGPPLDGGSAAFLSFVSSGLYGPAVLKVVLPDGLDGTATFASELAALSAGGYVSVLANDVERRALLLERLGRPLSSLGLGASEELSVLGRTVAAAWRPVDPAGFTTGASKAAYLARFVSDLFVSTGRPCAEATVAAALRCAEQRAAAFELSSAVLVHGDAHPANVLESLASPGSFKLIDPEGLVSEAAHDLGVVLRGFDPGDGGVDQLRAWCSELSSAAGWVDPAAVWDWACLERVSSGLYLVQLGLVEEGRRFLRVADLVAAVSPSW